MTVTPTFRTTGSILAGTAAHRLVGIDTALDVASSADPAVITDLVEQAERMCFVLDAVEHPHPVRRTVTLNGTALR